MITVLRRIAGVVSMLYVVVAVTIALIMLLTPRLFGWQFATVLSGSMEPVMPVGSVAVILPVDPADVRPGDVITYTQHGRTISHRVLQVEGAPGSLSFLTKGDANEDADVEPVSQAAIKGRVRFDVFFGGYVVKAIRTPVGMGTMTGLTVLMLVLGGVATKKRNDEDDGDDMSEGHDADADADADADLDLDLDLDLLAADRAFDEATRSGRRRGPGKRRAGRRPRVAAAGATAARSASGPTTIPSPRAPSTPPAPAVPAAPAAPAVPAAPAAPAGSYSPRHVSPAATDETMVLAPAGRRYDRAPMQ